MFNKTNVLSVAGVTLALAGVVLNIFKERNAKEEQLQAIEEAVNNYMNDHAE